jgi:propionyl-CoA synthetase
VLRDAAAAADPAAAKQLEASIMAAVDRHLGAIGRPTRVHFVTLLPKTRLGKLLRRAIAALSEGRDPGDLPTIEDASALQLIREAVAAGNAG